MMPVRLWGALGAIVGVLGLLTFSHVKAYRAGAAAERLSTLNRSVEILRKRSAIDDQTRNMNSGSLCRALGGQWVPDDGTCQ